MDIEELPNWNGCCLGDYIYTFSKWDDNIKSTISGEIPVESENSIYIIKSNIHR